MSKLVEALGRGAADGLVYRASKTGLPSSHTFASNFDKVVTGELRAHQQ